LTGEQQAEVLAQRAAVVLGAEYAPLLQQRYHGGTPNRAGVVIAFTLGEGDLPG
jgi:hypothetical protein